MIFELFFYLKVQRFKSFVFLSFDNRKKSQYFHFDLFSYSTQFELLELNGIIVKLNLLQIFYGKFQKKFNFDEIFEIWKLKTFLDQKKFLSKKCPCTFFLIKEK